jgi:hypothetical protein
MPSDKPKAWLLMLGVRDNGVGVKEPGELER